jgi:hypothetical protein
MAAVVSYPVCGMFLRSVNHIFAFGIHSLSKYFQNTLAAGIERLTEAYDSFAQSSKLQFVGTSWGPSGGHLSSGMLDRYINCPTERSTRALVNMSQTFAHAYFIHARRTCHKQRKSSMPGQTCLRTGEATLSGITPGRGPHSLLTQQQRLSITKFTVPKTAHR